jgi:hypothetical protein
MKKAKGCNQRKPAPVNTSARDALETIVKLIAEDKFQPNYLIGMINGHAKAGLEASKPDRD